MTTLDEKRNIRILKNPQGVMLKVVDGTPILFLVDTFHHRMITIGPKIRDGLKEGIWIYPYEIWT